jgi:RNA polymerase sigma-70 factor (ECF subfamily)
MGKSSTPSQLRQENRRFTTTRWSIVVAAGKPDAASAKTALATLCETYWYPVYAFVRRRGYSAHDAQDCTQEFFAALLEKDYVRAAERERGRFRTFLLTAVSRFLSKQRDRARARKRGGGRKVFSIDVEAGEGRYQLEPVDRWTPELMYERGWALALLERVVLRLGQRYAEQGKSALFDRLKPSLTGSETEAVNTKLASELDLTAGALKVAVHRLRRRYRDLLKEEIADTVASSDDVTNEFEYLLAALRGNEQAPTHR